MDFIYFCFGHSGGLNPACIRILPKGFFVPGILNNIQQIRQNVFSSYHQDRYRYLRCVFLARLILLPTLASMGRIQSYSHIFVHYNTLHHCQPSDAHTYIQSFSFSVYKYMTYSSGKTDRIGAPRYYGLIGRMWTYVYSYGKHLNIPAHVEDHSFRGTVER